jgi:hypothetical protein
MGIPFFYWFQLLLVIVAALDARPGEALAADAAVKSP